MSGKKFKLGFLTHVFGTGEPKQLYNELIEIFVAAEKLGYDGGWIAQHHLSGGKGKLPSPLVFFGALAARTKRIEFGTAITVLPLEDAIRFGEDAAVLDAISGGRLQLGLGSGGANSGFFEQFGERWDAKAQLLQDRQQQLARVLAGDGLGGGLLALEPPAPSLKDRLWHSHATVEGAVYAAQQGNGFLIGSAVHHPEKVQKPLVDAYLQAWDSTKGPSRIGVIRAVFPQLGDPSLPYAVDADLAEDVLAFGEWLRRENLLQGEGNTDESIRLLNVHHGPTKAVIESLALDPAVFQYADYFVPVVQSANTTVAAAIERLEIIATKIAPAFGWHPA